jgi:pyruvate,water dikinase
LIGSNDLTQLTLGVDRDSEKLADLFDEQDEAVKWMIRSVIREAHEAGSKVGLCGQAPSDHPEFAEFLVQCGIDSISVSPDSFVAVKQRVALAEGEGIRDALEPAGDSVQIQHKFHKRDRSGSSGLPLT